MKILQSLNTATAGNSVIHTSNTTLRICCRITLRVLNSIGISKPSGGLLLRRLGYVPLLVAAALLLAGCPKGNEDFSAAQKANALQDYDTALVHYERALRADPTNAEYKLRAAQARYDAGQFHIHQGEKAIKLGDLQLALAEFQKTQLIDPSNVAADQEVKRTTDMIAEQNIPPKAGSATPNEQNLSAPPELKPLSREPINLKMTNDARVVLRDDRQAGGSERDFRSGLHIAADHSGIAERHFGAGAGRRIPGEQGILEACDADSDIRRAGPAAKAQGPGRRSGPDFLSLEYADAAGLDRSGERIAAVAGPASPFASERAERDRDSRHAGQTVARRKNYPGY